MNEGGPTGFTENSVLMLFTSLLLQEALLPTRNLLIKP